MQYFQHHLQWLVAQNTTSSLQKSNNQSNLPLLQRLKTELEKCGAKVEFFLIPNSNDKFNLLATFNGQKSQQGGLLLAGHTDTVACNPEHWQSDPFQLFEKDERFYGLGAVDMKSFFAILLSILQNNDFCFDYPLYLLATADEEISMAGAKAFLTEVKQLKDFSPQLTIIGEPTELKPIHAHKGHIALNIEISSNGGHASDPSSGINAIEVMYHLIAELLVIRKALENYQSKDFSVPYPTMNFGKISGGDSINRIASHASLQVEIRPLAAMPLETFLINLEKRLTALAQFFGATIKISHLHPPIQGFALNKNSPHLKTLCELTGEAFQAVNYCTEASFLQGVSDTVILGAGSIRQAHAANEYIEKSQVKKGLILFEKIIRQYTESC